MRQQMMMPPFLATGNDVRNLAVFVSADGLL